MNCIHGMALSCCSDCRKATANTFVPPSPRHAWASRADSLPKSAPDPAPLLAVAGSEPLAESSVPLPDLALQPPQPELRVAVEVEPLSGQLLSEPSAPLAAEALTPSPATKKKSAPKKAPQKAAAKASKPKQVRQELEEIPLADLLRVVIDRLYEQKRRLLKAEAVFEKLARG